MVYTPYNQSGWILDSTPSQICAFKEIYLNFGMCTEHHAVCTTSIQKVGLKGRIYIKHGWKNTNCYCRLCVQRNIRRKIIRQWHYKIAVRKHWFIKSSLWLCWSFPLCICFLFQLLSVIYLQFPSLGIVYLFLAI